MNPDNSVLDFTPFPYIKGEVMMIYTLKDTIQKAAFANDTHYAFKDVADMVANISWDVTAKLKQVNDLARQKIEQLYKYLLNTNQIEKAEDIQKAVINMINDKIKSFGDECENEALKGIRRAYAELSQETGDKKSVIDTRKKEINRLFIDTSKIEGAIRKIDFKRLQIEANAKGLSKEAAQEFLVELIKKEFFKVSEKITQEAIMKKRKDSTLRTYFTAKPSSRSDIKYFGFGKDFDEAIRKFAKTDFSKSTSGQEIENQLSSLAKATVKEIKVALRQECVKIMEEYTGDIKNILSLANSNVVNIKNKGQVEKTIKKESESRKVLAAKVGLLYEVAELMKFGSLQLKNADGSLAAVEHIPYSVDKDAVADLAITMKQGKEKIKANVSVKSAIDISVIFSTISTKNRETIIDEQVKNSLKTKEAQWFFINNFSALVSGNNPAGDDGYINLVARLRYEYGRLLAIKYVLGFFFVASGKNLSDADLQKYKTALSSVNDFPIFLSNPQGVVLTTDVIDELISNIGNTKFGGQQRSLGPKNKHLYDNDKTLKTAILQEFPKLPELAPLGYSYIMLRMYHEQPEQYKNFYDQAVLENKWSPTDQFRYIPPYRDEDLKLAFSIMREITKNLNDEKLFEILVSNIQLFAKNAVANILQSKYN